MQEPNPFYKASNKQNSSAKFSSNTKFVKGKTATSQNGKSGNKELDEYKKDYYKQKFDDLDDQLDSYRRNRNREAFKDRVRPTSPPTPEPLATKAEKPADNIVIQKERIVVQGGGGGCLPGLGCLPFAWILKPRCCGCFVLLILLIIGFVYAFIKVPFVQDFSLENIFPSVLGQVDTSKIPDSSFFSIPDHLNSEIVRVNTSTNSLENITIFQSELNTWLQSYVLTMWGSDTDKYVRIEDGKVYIYIRRHDKKDPWTILTLQSDKLGKPQLIQVQYGSISLSGEAARNFLNNLPLNIGNINVEKLDEKINTILFGENSLYKIDKVVFLSEKVEISLIRK